MTIALSRLTEFWQGLSSLICPALAVLVVAVLIYNAVQRRRGK